MSAVPVTLRAEVAAIDLAVAISCPSARAACGARRPRRPGRLPVRRERQARPRPSGRQRRPARDPDLGHRRRSDDAAATITPQEALMRLGASTAEAVAQVLETFAPGASSAATSLSLPEGTSPFAQPPAGHRCRQRLLRRRRHRRERASLIPPAGARSSRRRWACRAAEDGGGRGALRARALGRGRGGQPDDGRGGRRDQRRDRPGDRDLAAGHAGAGRSRSRHRGLRHRAPRFLDDVLDRRRVLPADPARAQRVRGAHGRGPSTSSASSDADAEAGGRRRRRSRPRPALLATRSATSSCASGPSSDAPVCRWATRSSLPLGAVLDLDRAADAPVDLFVNGLRFAQGHLLVTEDGEWALRLDEASAGGRTRPVARRRHGELSFRADRSTTHQ